jgi:hypothetical protein
LTVVGNKENTNPNTRESQIQTEKKDYESCKYFPYSKLKEVNPLWKKRDCQAEGSAWYIPPLKYSTEEKLRFLLVKL